MAHASAPGIISPVEIGYNLINGKKPEQELTLIPVELITKENVNQYKGWSK